MYETYHSRWIECITGSMFSGKSEELIRRLRRGIYAKQKVVVFKPAIDDRYHKEKVGLCIMVMPLKRLIFLKQVKL